MVLYWEYKELFKSDPILKITALFSKLAKYGIKQVYARREEKVIATGGDGGKEKPGLC